MGWVGGAGNKGGCAESKQNWLGSCRRAEAHGPYRLDLGYLIKITRPRSNHGVKHHKAAGLKIKETGARGWMVRHAPSHIWFGRPINRPNLSFYFISFSYFSLFSQIWKKTTLFSLLSSRRKGHRRWFPVRRRHRAGNLATFFKNKKNPFSILFSFSTPFFTQKF